MADLSMLELFRMEAESHTQTLRSGLPELSDALSQEKIHPLIHAANGLRGAARIVGLADAVSLAQAMETVLEEFQNGNLTASSGLIPPLLAGTEFLASLGAEEAANMESWMDENKETFESILNSLKNRDAVPEDAATPDLDKIKTPAPADTDAAKEFKNPPKPKTEQMPEPVTQAVEPKLEINESSSPARTEKEDIPLADLSMLDLFRMEAESHSQSLNSGLLELEKNQSADKVEPLMRAAHSMKGAARIVGLTDAVALAHAMEDLLVSCQKGEVVLNSTQIDILLSATDIYKEASLIDTDEIQEFLAEKKPLMDNMEKALRGDKIAVKEVCSEVCPNGMSKKLLTSEELIQDAEPAADPTPKPTPAQSKKTNTAPQKDAVVRVSAENLNRLMALAGESLVEAGRLGSFASSLLRIKGRQRDLMKSLEEGCERVINGDSPADVLDELKEVLADCQLQLVKHVNEFDLYRRRSDNVSGRLYHEVIASRMRPFSDGGRGFPRLVRDLARSLGKEIDFVIEGAATSVDRDILEKLEAPMNHLIRNSVDHGIEMADERVAAGKPARGTIKIVAGHRAGMLFIEIHDDGKGLDPEQIRAKVIEKGLAPARMAAEMTRAELMEFLFLPGFSTAGKVTEISGRGVGLDVVHAMVQEVGGTVRAESNPGQGMSFSLQLPLTLSVIRTLLVEISGQPYAIPLSRISRIASVFPDQLQLVEDRQYISLNGANVGLVPAAQILGAASFSTDKEVLKVVVISDRMNKYGLVIDDFIGEQDLVVRPLDHRLGAVPDVSSVALMPDGSPVLILDAEDLVRSIDNLLSGGRLNKVGVDATEAAQAQKILVVDDSLTVREVERKLLANYGYDVDTAVDGQDGFNAVLAGDYDLVITDVDMPRMNGLELTRRIKADPDMKSIPVMMVSYKDRKEDKLRGLEAGADYYLTKSSFHDETLLSAVEDLIGGVTK
ncbi:response regulator [Maridesulfovibrio hydrothermalis]|uniref:histidine kinase n=1 Tax=Maridesulfovibrio hydrothermalis AM13 = DSM 14728 TaxID=1121451 RepID=L0RAB9_9BACT|nr:response regulator [Maridesulfovibrio hydrothermalis]CCO23135.1 CheA signal transduction histidine kinase [Maridesulfovibrio hydrothermalis AM13 = DSM 14728]